MRLMLVIRHRSLSELHLRLLRLLAHLVMYLTVTQVKRSRKPVSGPERAFNLVRFLRPACLFMLP